jgi:predicted NAD-dependent protein-ADP-ribosyltransferase YbiA (DUF1768 family)
MTATMSIPYKWNLVEYQPEEVIAGFTGEYDFLSMWAPARVRMYATSYPTVMHAYLDLMTLGHYNEAVLKLETEEEVWTFRQMIADKTKKVLGAYGSYDTFPRYPNKVFYLVPLLRQKFTYGTEYADRLLATGEKRLLNIVPYNDKELGIYDDYGRNVLGKQLHQRRRALRILDSKL